MLILRETEEEREGDEWKEKEEGGREMKGKRERGGREGDEGKERERRERREGGREQTLHVLTSILKGFEDLRIIDDILVVVFLGVKIAIDCVITRLGNGEWRVLQWLEREKVSHFFIMKFVCSRHQTFLPP